MNRNKNGVSHSYMVTIPTMKTKLFHLVIHYVSCRTFFRITMNIISCMYKVKFDPSLHFWSRHHVSNFVKVVYVVNLQLISNILRRLWVFLLVLGSTTHQSTSYFHLRICVYVEKHHIITNLHGCALPMFQQRTGEIMFEMVFNFLIVL
jgi:hypothetical protein